MALLFSFMCLGYFFGKRRIIDSSHSRLISVLCVNLFMPCTVFKAFYTNFNREYITRYSLFLLVSLSALVVLVVVGDFVSKKLSPAHFLGFAIEIAYMLMVDTITMDHFRIIASLAVLLMLLCLVICHSSITAFDVAVSLFGFFYVGFLLANI